MYIHYNQIKYYTMVYPVNIENRQSKNFKFSKKCTASYPNHVLISSNIVDDHTNKTDDNLTIKSNIDKLELKNEIKELLIRSVEKRTDGLSRCWNYFFGWCRQHQSSLKYQMIWE